MLTCPVCNEQIKDQGAFLPSPHTECVCLKCYNRVTNSLPEPASILSAGQLNKLAALSTHPSNLTAKFSIGRAMSGVGQAVRNGQNAASKIPGVVSVGKPNRGTALQQVLDRTGSRK